jgi:uroporphyrinogen-III synthase
MANPPNERPKVLKSLEDAGGFDAWIFSSGSMARSASRNFGATRKMPDDGRWLMIFRTLPTLD